MFVRENHSVWEQAGEDLSGGIELDIDPEGSVLRSKYNRLKSKKGRSEPSFYCIARNLLIRIRRILLGGSLRGGVCLMNWRGIYPKRFGLTANFHLVPEMNTFCRMRRSVELTDKNPVAFDHE